MNAHDSIAPADRRFRFAVTLAISVLLLSLAAWFLTNAAVGWSDPRPIVVKSSDGAIRYAGPTSAMARRWLAFGSGALGVGVLFAAITIADLRALARLRRLGVDGKNWPPIDHPRP